MTDLYQEIPQVENGVIYLANRFYRNNRSGNKFFVAYSALRDNLSKSETTIERIYRLKRKGAGYLYLYEDELKANYSPITSEEYWQD